MYQHTKAGIEYLFEQNCLIVIIACNTASAETLRTLQDDWLPKNYPDRKILGMTIPTIEEVCDGGYNEVTLLATQRTINSRKYEKEFTKYATRDIRITPVAAPRLVPLLEAGSHGEAVRVAQFLLQGNVSEGGGGGVLVLGCTHYVLLKDALRKYYGDEIQIVSQDEIIPDKLQLYFKNHPETEERFSTTGTRTIYLTEQRSHYDQLFVHLLGSPTGIGGK